MPTKKFAKKELQEVIWEDESENLVKVVEEIIGEGRWTLACKLVFREKATHQLYFVIFSRGKTEQQDERPLEYDPDEIEAREVRAVEKVVTVYELI